jgi:WD40 repeat protein
MKGRIHLTLLSVGFLMGIQPAFSNPSVQNNPVAERYQIQPPTPQSMELIAPSIPSSRPKNTATPIANSPLDQQANQALQRFETGEQLLGLIAAMKTGQALRDATSGENYSTTTPVLALQSMLDRIRERNHFSEAIVTISPDGERVVVRKGDKLQVWSTSGQKLGEIVGESATFSPDGQRILTTQMIFADPTRSAPTSFKVQLHSRDGRASIKLAELKLSDRIDFLPNSKGLILQQNKDQDATILLLDNTGKTTAQLKDIPEALQSVKVSSDGSAIALQTLTSQDENSPFPNIPGDVLIYNAAGQQTGKIANQSEYVFAPDGQTILTVDRSSSTVKLQRVDRFGKVIETIPNLSLSNKSLDQISPDGNYLILKSRYEQGEFRDREAWSITGKQVRDFVPTETPFSPNGKQAVGIRRINGLVQVQVIDLDTEVLNSGGFLPNEPLARAISIDPYQKPQAYFTATGQLVVVDFSTGMVQHWDTSRMVYGDIGAGTYVGSRAFDKLAEFTIPNIQADPSLLLANPTYVVSSPTEASSVALWDVMVRHLVQFTLQLPGDVAKYYQVGTLQFSEDGQRLEVSGESDRQLFTVKGEKLDGIVSPNQKVAAIIQPDGSTQLRDVVTQRTIKTLEGTFYGFSPNGQRLLTREQTDSMNYRNTIRVWDISGRELGEFEIESANLPSFSWSRDGSSVAVGSENINLASTVKVWRDGRTTTIQRPEGVSNTVQLSADGQRLIVSGIDSRFPSILYSTTGEKIRELPGNAYLSFTPNGTHLLVFQQAFNNQSSPTPRLLSARTGEPLAELVGVRSPQSMLYHKDGNRFLSYQPPYVSDTTVPDANKIKLWNGNGQSIADLLIEPTATPTNPPRFSVKLSPNHEIIAIANYKTGMVTLWNWQGKEVARLDGKLKRDTSPLTPQIAFSPDQQKVAIAGDDGVLRLWDKTGNPLGTIQTNNQPLDQIPVFSPDSQRIATMSNFAIAEQLTSWVVHLWTLDGKLVGEWQPPAQQKGVALQFSPDGKQIAAADSGNTVYLWQINTLDQLLERGCRWLQPYLNQHSDVKVEACQTN